MTQDKPEDGYKVAPTPNNPNQNTTDKEYDHILTPSEMQAILSHGATVIEFDGAKVTLRDGFSDTDEQLNE